VVVVMVAEATAAATAAAATEGAGGAATAEAAMAVATAAARVAVARVAVAAEAALHQTLRIMIPQVTRLMNLELVAADGTFPPSWSRVATEEGSEERSVPSRGAAAAAAADAMADAAAVVAADAASHHSVAADAASQHQQQTAAAEGSEEKELQVAPPQHRAEGLQLEGPTSGDRVRTVPQRLDASMLAVPQYGYHHGKPNPTPKPN